MTKQSSLAVSPPPQQVSMTKQSSLAVSPSPPQASMTKQHAVGGEDLANFTLNNISMECQLHLTSELVECQLEFEDEFYILGGIQVGQV